MRTLTMTFKTTEDKNKTIRFTNYTANLDESAVQEIMTIFMENDQFIKEGIDQYDQPVACNVVETSTTKVLHQNEG